MRRRLKWLWWAKWAGTLLSGALLAACIATPFVGFQVSGSRGNTNIGDAAWRYLIGREKLEPGFEFGCYKPPHLNPRFVLRPTVHADGRFAEIPLWMPLFLVLIPTVLLWRCAPSIPPNHCRKCGYNLTGNLSGVCPECGTKRAG